MLGVLSITFLKDYRCFKKDDRIELRGGLNLLVGDQGTGKSTILELIKNPKKDIAFLDIPQTVQLGGFDFEKSNPRVQSAFGGVDGKMPMMFQIGSMWRSHGETNITILESLGKTVKNCVVVLDEPDQALSIRSLWQVCQLLDEVVENNVQVIAAVHSPILIVHADKVYSLEHREWMTGGDFITSQKSPPVTTECGGPCPV